MSSRWTSAATSGGKPRAGDRRRRVDEPVHPPVVAHLLDVLLGQDEQQLVDGSALQRDEFDLHRVRAEQAPERDCRPGSRATSSSTTMW